MIIRVAVFYKPSVFDPQGETILNSLHSLGFKKVNRVRTGKVFDLDLQANSQEEARSDATKICEKLLVNQVIESYEILSMQ